MKSTIIILLLIALCSASLNLSLSDQGAGVRYLNGTLLEQGNLTVYIFTSISGTPVHWQNTYVNGIINGTWNVMLENVSLEFDREYWKDYVINGDNMSFDGQDRLHFFSPLGDVNSSDLAQSINLSNATGYPEADPLWSANYTLFNASWSSTFNATYDAKVTDNQSWNQTLADSLYATQNSTVARIGSCPAGGVVQNTTTSGVQCVSPLFSYTETDPLWSANYSLFNDSWSSTFNATYDAKVSDNTSWNETRANTLYATQNNTVARTGTATCGAGQVVQNVTTSTSGVTTQCVTDQGSGTPFTGYNFTSADVVTTSTTAWTSLFTIPLTTGKTVMIDCDLLSNSSAATVGVQVAVNYTGTSERRIGVEYFTSATALATCFWSTADGSCLAASSGGTTVTPIRIHGHSVQSSNGIINVSIRSEAAGTTVVLEGAWCRTVEK